MRAHPEPIGYHAPLPRSPILHQSIPATVLLVVPLGERALYGSNQSTRYFAHSAAEALRTLATTRPRVVVVDWDDPSLGGRELCSAASATSGTSALVMTAKVENAPAILKAGCQGLLLKPFAPSLLAGRIGRVIRETATGTNRVWPDVPCPTCGTRGVTSFDFSSYRRMWYACLSCDATWLGPRKE
jgi:CheY-like chemotaxis protein